MEIAWKVTNFFVGLILIGLCSGFPIGLENSAADYHTQFLTGLVGVLLTVCGVVFLVGCLCCQRKNGFKEFHNSPVVASSTSSLDHGHINPIANGEFTIFTPLSPPHHNNNVFLANEQIVGQTEIDYNHADIDVHSWFDGTERDFPRTKLKYIKELGKGWFGRVVEGTAQGLNGSNDENWMPVAVRILEASATSSERAVFLHDATIYRCGKHPHILQLLGRSLESVPLLLLQELGPRGDLKKYLRDNQGTSEKLLSSDLPLLWCCQLSSAIKHLHDHRLAHPDLAARNCQIVSDLSLKLGDYGLAASLYPEDYYQGAPAVPVRWCAPESLTYTSTTIQPKQITFEGNVWSLGVTMWEIYMCGAQPYGNLSDDDVISQVLGSANVRLAKPEFSILYTDYIFRLIQLCWSTSESRPSVSQVHLMLTDLLQVYQNTKHITHSEPLSIQDFDKRWDNFKPNSVSRTDNQEFNLDNKSTDLDLSDITILNMNLNKDELLNTKPMSPSLNNLHGSLDNLTGVEMDSWLQKVANKTGDMSYVRGLSEAIKDLDNALALENVSSSDSSHQPSPAPENLPKVKSKLEFKLGPTTKTSNDSNNKTQNSSLTESIQRTSSESETEDENWRRKIEQGAYSEKVHQKSKSVTDLMILTHIDCSESDSETPLPSLDYRVNYRNVRYAPKQNLENVSLMFGSEGNLLSVHDKFQEELKRLQEERKDSLLFVPEYNSHKDDQPNHEYPLRRTENSSSDEETWSFKKNEDVTCTYVNTKPSTSIEQQNSNVSSKNTSPNHRKPEALIEELSSPTDIQPANQVYNIFSVTVSPMHIRPDLKEIICFEEPEQKAATKDLSESPKFQVPKLMELIQNNDDLMDYIITRYESQENLNLNAEPMAPKLESEIKKELNNNIQNSTVILKADPSDAPPVAELAFPVLSTHPDSSSLTHPEYSSTRPDISSTHPESSSSTHPESSSSTHPESSSLTHPVSSSTHPESSSTHPESSSAHPESSSLTHSESSSSTHPESATHAKPKCLKNIQTTQEFLHNEQANYEVPKIPLKFDVSQTQEEVSPSSMTHSAIFSSTPLVKRNLDSFVQDKPVVMNFDLSSENEGEILQFSSNFADIEDEDKSEMKYSLETWDNFLGKALEGSREGEFEDFTSEPQSLLFVDGKDVLDTQSVECKNEALIDGFNWKSDDDLIEDKQDVSLEDVNNEEEKECSVLTEPKTEDLNSTFAVVKADKTFTLEQTNESVADVNDVTIVLADGDLLNKTYDKNEASSSSNWGPGQGWFLHPQANSEVSGQMEVPQSGDTESYVGFSMDDEIMAAIRNELLMKLPQAQGQSSEQIKDLEEWDAEGRSEVLIKYNVYTTPLSPIPEESYSENDSHHFIYNRQDSSSDSENGDWPEPYEEEHNSGLADTETRSLQNIESPVHEPPHRHTPSQDSCCSNDTLFNLEELTYVLNENDNTVEKRCEENEKKNEVDVERTFIAEGQNKAEDVCDIINEDEIKEVQVAGTNDKELAHTVESRIEYERIATTKQNEESENLTKQTNNDESILKTDETTNEDLININIEEQITANAEEKVATIIDAVGQDVEVSDKNKNEESEALVDSLLKISVNEVEIVTNPAVHKDLAIQSNLEETFIVQNHKETEDARCEVINRNLKNHIQELKAVDNTEAKGTPDLIGNSNIQEKINAGNTNGEKMEPSVSKRKVFNPESAVNSSTSKTDVKEVQNLKNEVNVNGVLSDTHENGVIDINKSDIADGNEVGDNGNETVANKDEVVANSEVVADKSRIVGDTNEVIIDKSAILANSEVCNHINEATSNGTEALGYKNETLTDRANKSEIREIIAHGEVLVNGTEVIVNRNEAIANRCEALANEDKGIVHSNEFVDRTEVSANKNEAIVDKSEIIADSEVLVNESEVTTDKSEVIVNKSEAVANKNEAIIHRNEVADKAEVNANKNEVVNKSEVIVDKSEALANNEGVADGSEVIADKNEVIVNPSEVTTDRREAITNKDEVVVNTSETIVDYEVPVNENEVFANRSEVSADRTEVIASTNEVSEAISLIKNNIINDNKEVINNEKQIIAATSEFIKQEIKDTNRREGNEELINLGDARCNTVNGNKSEDICNNKPEVNIIKSEISSEYRGSKSETSESPDGTNKVSSENQNSELSSQNREDSEDRDNKSEVNSEKRDNKCEVSFENKNKSEVCSENTDKSEISSNKDKVDLNVVSRNENQEVENEEVKASTNKITINRNETDADKIEMNRTKNDLIHVVEGEVSSNKNEVSQKTNENQNKSEVYIVKNEITEVKVNKIEENPGHVIINDDGNLNMDEIKCEITPNIIDFGNHAEHLASQDLDDIKEIKIEDINITFLSCEEANSVENKDSIEKNLTDADKLIIKNVQNGIVIPEKASKWLDDISISAANENDANLINVFESLDKLENTNADISQTKETNEGFSLLVENNPNYVTEFLNHERQSSISSLGSSRDDDDFNQSELSHVSISLHNSKNVTLATDNSEIVNSQLLSDRDYVNINDITLKLVDEPKSMLSHDLSDTVSYVNADELQAITSQPDYVNLVEEDLEEHLYDPVASDSVDVDIYDALSDIRFTGPSDIQLMSTSFSESADIDEQDWDSGSDTRSSSSGEFIWKEGEHEESVKALRAAPQDVSATEKVIPMEDIEEVTSESSDEDEGDSPEFVPSAWDKYATPTKSALRSPEKTLEKSEVNHKKPKGVWFKKQKYHCVYEYPREPESPSVSSYELWQPVSTSLIDWEVDTSPYIPTLDGTDGHPDSYQQLDKHARNLYQLSDFTSGMTTLDDEFFISSTAKPFETFGGLSSQFFPGQNMSDQWMDLTKQPNENITPDSGTEDITPASNVDCNEFLQEPPKFQIQSLKALAGAVLKQNQINDSKSNNKGTMGGLRHARNKLKLDLPPSPSAFTSTKAFTIEPPEEPVMKREVPTFTTFGKSRFLVQHVDTPTFDELNESKNVSFEALPYKPLPDKAKVEIVRGEASLLDSADEDSGIESSTLERKKITNIAD